jgi:hypothetical protein
MEILKKYMNLPKNQPAKTESDEYDSIKEIELSIERRGGSNRLIDKYILTEPTVFIATF